MTWGLVQSWHVYQLGPVEGGQAPGSARGSRRSGPERASTGSAPTTSAITPSSVSRLPARVYRKNVIDGPPTLRPAPEADQEEQRDQRELEEDVEQDDVRLANSPSKPVSSARRKA